MCIRDRPFTDKETGKQCTATNIIVQYAKHGSYNDKAGHISISLVGSGNAESVSYTHLDVYKRQILIRMT